MSSNLKEHDSLLRSERHRPKHYDGVEVPKKPPPPKPHQQAAAFFLVFIGYLFTQAARKALSNVKSSLMKTWTSDDTQTGAKVSVEHDVFESEDAAESFLGILDALFMLGYAISLFVAGRLGDYMDAHKLFAWGMWVSGVTLFLFGYVTEWLTFYNKAWYCITYFSFGLAQGLPKPVSVRVLAEWFPRKHYGKVIGFYALSYCIGRIAGSYMSSAVLDFGYEYVFLLHSHVLLCLGFIEYFGLVNSPKDLGCMSYSDEVPEPNEIPEDLHHYKRHHDPPPPPKKLTPWRVMLLPGVFAYSISYAGIKMVNYAITFWLPLYCVEALGWSEKMADMLSTFFDIGGFFGTLFVGLAWDRIPKGRNVLLVILIFIAAGFMYLYSETPAVVVLNCTVLFLCGIFHWAVYNAEGAIASTSLAPKGRSGDSVVSSVTGITNGFGSLAGAVACIVVPLMEEEMGWNSVFYFFTLAHVISGLCICPLGWAEIRDMRKTEQYENLENSDFGSAKKDNHRGPKTFEDEDSYQVF